MESTNDVFPQNAKRKGVELSWIWLGTTINPWCSNKINRRLKTKNEWDKVDNEGSEADARALFSIFNSVCPNRFHKIANCKCAKEAWDILQVTNEGMPAVKISKLQCLLLNLRILGCMKTKNFLPSILN